MNYLQTLSSLDCPAGFERNATAKLKEMLFKYTDDISVSTLGSTVAYIHSSKTNAKKIMISAHIDSVFSLVTELLEGGFVRIAVNGMDRRVMLNAEYTILGRNGNVRAVPCVLPPHLQKESGKVPEDGEMILDTGLSLENMKEKISVGDPIIFTPNYAELLGNRTVCTSADNRASCAAVFEALDIIKDKQLDVDVIVAFTACEEVNASGSETVAFKYQPDEAIILDVSFAETPDTHPPKCGNIGAGTMIGTAPILSRRLFEKLKAAAERIGEKYQVEVMTRRTGTDADVIVSVGKGVECGMLSTPLRYMHSPAEVTDSADIASTAAVLAEYLINS